MEIRIIQKQHEKSHQGKLIFSETDFSVFTINSSELQKFGSKKEVKQIIQGDKIIYSLKLKTINND